MTENFLRGGQEVRTQNFALGLFLICNFWCKCNFFEFLAWFDVDETLWDLGFNISLLDDFNFVDKSIEYLNTEFDVVLIAEQFDESLIVMKDHLCWNTEDILYLKV